MNRFTSIRAPLKALVKGDSATLAQDLRGGFSAPVLLPLILVIAAGCAAYGFAIGLWRSPLQGAFVAVKMPCLIFLTLLVNGLLNGMLGQLLGAGMSFRQTVMACLMSFAIFSLVVGSLSPIAMAVVLDAPRPGAPGADGWYRAILLTHTAIIAFAGIIANHKLLRLLQVFSGSVGTGWRTLTAWLAGNLFVGAQLSYNLRPFFGNPKLPVQFLRPDPFDGSFYESIWKLTMASLPTGMGRMLIGGLALFGIAFALLFIARRLFLMLKTIH